MRPLTGLVLTELPPRSERRASLGYQGLSEKKEAKRKRRRRKLSSRVVKPIRSKKAGKIIMTGVGKREFKN